MRRAIVLRRYLPIPPLLALLAAACGDSRPVASRGSFVLSAPDVTVEVETRPYRLHVRDARGREVLASSPELADGYAPFGWTTGAVHWTPGLLSKGYFLFGARLDPWRQRWEVVAASQPDAAHLELTVRGVQGETAVVTHALREGALRVEMRLASGDHDEPPRAWMASFGSDASEAFLGFGERFNRTNQRGVRVYSWAEEGGIGTGEGTLAGQGNPAPNGEAMSYYPVPFFVSTHGYGFWLDTTWRTEIDAASDRDDAWRAWTLGPSLAYEVFVPRGADGRPWPVQLVDAFTARTGRPMLPPAWTFGPRRRIGRGSVRDGVPEIQAMRDRDLAITGVDDAVHFLPRGSHVGIEDELTRWVADGHRLGYAMNGYYNSLFAAGDDNPIRDVVQTGLDQGYFLREAGGAPSTVDLISGSFLSVYQVDFTSPAATAFYQGTLSWALDLGYDGWMEDFGEYVQPRVIASNGMTGEEMHNLYPVLYQQAAHDALEAGPRAGEWLTFARSGYTGASQYSPMVWSGDPAASFEDSDGLPSMVRGAINMGISGVPHWGGDIGGFHCAADGHHAADGELLARWIQQGSMTPNMQDQDACSFALDDGDKASLWTSPDAMESWRTYARLHTRLFPYVFTLSHLAHETGIPIVRHVLLEHPDRIDLASVDDAYYYGPALYVAPVVVRGARQKTVDLPAGLYLDWNHQRLVEGGARVTLDAPLAELPLLLRDGYLIPMLDPSIDTLAEEDNPDVVGPTDVADVYDVVGLLSQRTGGATFTLWDGGTLEARLAGAFAPPPGAREAATEDDLSDCTAVCWRRDDLGGGLSRVRITHAGGDLSAGGLSLRARVGRRVRWDLYLVE